MSVVSYIIPSRRCLVQFTPLLHCFTLS